MTDQDQDERTPQHGFVLQSTPEAVRNFLIEFRVLMRQAGHNADGDTTWELVIAEVLNNIVEHAYSERADGVIHLTIALPPKRLLATFEDHGAQMPSGALPAGNPANLDVAVQDLPEGGFGWYLIRSLTDRLEYHPLPKGNRLYLELSLNP